VSKKPWMRWHVDRWRKSGRVLAMTLAARGAFFELLQAAWERGGSLPNQPELFWRFAQASSPAEFDAVKDQVLAMFTESADGKALTNDTLSAEYENAEQYMAQLSEKRRTAANVRWDKKRCKNANGMQGASKPIHISSSSSSTDQEPSSDAGASSVPQLRGVVKTVFDYYLSRTGRNPKQYEFTDKRRDKGVSRLKEFQKQCDGDLEKAAGMMRRAVDGICADPWDDRVKFREWDAHLFVSQEKAEKWRNAPLSKANGKMALLPVDNAAADRELARQLGRA
jgi:uncharacterized protein YdaU (DUF1376 family)